MKKKKESKSIWVAQGGGIYLKGDTRKGLTRFRARLTVPLSDGKRKDHYGPHRKTRAEAETDLAQLKKDYQDGGVELLDAQRVTFVELAKEFSDAHLHAPKYVFSDDKRKMRKKSGVKSFRNGLGAMKLFVEFFGDRRLKTIKDEDIKRWRDQRQDVPKERGGEQRTEANLNRTLDWLRQAFNYAVKQGYLTAKEKPNVSNFMHMDMENQRERKLEDDEQPRLLGVANDFLKQVLIFLIYSGLRPSEARRVRREHVKLDQGRYGHLWLSADITKSKKRRDLPIFTPELRQVIVERLAMIDADPAAELFGEWRLNTPKKKRTLEHDLEFDAACEAADITDFRLHDCRRTCASRAVNAMPIAQVMRYLGWDDIKTLMRYVRTDQNMDDINTDNFAAYLKKSSATVASDQIN